MVPFMTRATIRGVPGDATRFSGANAGRSAASHRWMPFLLLAALWTLPEVASASVESHAGARTVAEQAEAAAVPGHSSDTVRRDVVPPRKPEKLTHGPSRRRAQTKPRPQVPWALVGAFGCALIVVLPLTRRLRRPGNRATAMGLAVLALITFVFRRLAFPEAFFHQNGHGAMWIGYALENKGSYGSGFFDVFNIPAVFGAGAPDHNVFVAHGVLASLAVVASWTLARAAGAPRPVAWAVAFVMAVEPNLGRLAQSESYFGVVAWLLLMAAALLASGARSGKVSSSRFVASVVGAGLLISQASVIHPISWLASAFIPLAAWVGPGALRRRTRMLLAATAGIGLVVLGWSGSEIFHILNAHARFAGGYAHSAVSNIGGAFLAILAYVGLLKALNRFPEDGKVRRFTRPALRWTLRLGALLVVVLVCDALHQLRGLTPWVRRAWWVPYLPALIAAGASLAMGLRDRVLARGVGALVVAAGIVFSAVGWREQTLLPTDALEARFATTWRETLPSDAIVLHIERAKERISVLPVYRVFGATVISIDLDGNLTPLAPAISAATHYHRSSLCSTPQAEAFCKKLESRWVLEPVAVTELPAIPSFPRMHYTEDSVRVGVYRIARPAPVSDTR